MKLGAFSISLAVKDLKASREFYQKLGFVEKHPGRETDNWTVLINGETVIGLFEGMFEDNILTFNPGWDQQAQPLDDFEDVRRIAEELDKAGIAFEQKVDPSKPEGPNHFVIKDPDGNSILVDQHR